jgi:hypothetical protein
MEAQNYAMKAQPGAVEPQNKGAEAHNGPAKGLKAFVVDSHHFDKDRIRIRIEVKSLIRSSDPAILRFSFE